MKSKYKKTGPKLAFPKILKVDLPLAYFYHLLPLKKHFISIHPVTLNQTPTHWNEIKNPKSIFGIALQPITPANCSSLLHPIKQSENHKSIIFLQENSHFVFKQKKVHTVWKICKNFVFSLEIHLFCALFLDTLLIPLLLEK